jgi:uncharacterized protein involved in cysteine biosynthesis
MALNADISASDEVKFRGIDNIIIRRRINMVSAGSVTLFTTNIPLGNFLRLYVVVC